MVEEAPGESGFQAASLAAGKMRNGDGRLRAGSQAHSSWATPAPRARRAGAGPEGGAPEGRAGGGHPSDSRRLRLGAERQSLSLCNAACDRSSAEVGACRCLRAATTAATANTTATMPNFAGTWKMRSSENFDELLKALGKLVRRGCPVY